MKKIFSAFLIIAFVLSIFSIYTIGSDVQIQNSGVIFASNDPRYVLNDDVLYHDNTNSGVTPIIYNNRMLVPLRSVATAFGAQVDFDSQNSQAVIKIEDKTILFPVGQSKMIINSGNDSETIKLDADCILIEGRTMVPIRALAENALNLKVDFKDGYAIIFENMDSQVVDKAISKLSNFRYYESYDEIKAVILKSFGDTGRYNYNSKTVLGMGEAVADQKTSLATADSGAKESSQTNVQVEGVDEADIIKTDGQYIYYMSSNSVKIVKSLSDNKLELVATINREDEKIWFRDMYVQDNKLVITGTANIYTILPAQTFTSGIEKKMIMPPSKNYTSVFIYDIADKSKPKILKSLELEGSSVSTRKIGNLMYLITQKYIYNNSNNTDDLIPTYRDSAKGDQVFTIEPNKIAILPNPVKSTYLNIAVIDVSNDTASNVQSVLGSGHTIYMNQEALYVAVNDYHDNSNFTDIIHFELSGKTVIPKNKASVPGNVLNQFAMDEYDGYFRIATTNWQQDGQVNNLYVFDKKNMEKTGEIKNIAPGESIYSVRFDKGTGYIVTFKQVDPLFKIDLKDPKNPKIIGQLKVPGYSNYLHPIGDNLVLGIGRDIKDTYMRDDKGKEVAVGTIDDGLKLSLFDVSKDTPVELDTLKISSSRNIYTQAQNDHKALVFDKEKNLVLFSVSDYSISSKTGASNYGVVIKINDNNLTLDAKLAPKSSSDYSYNGESRLCYIGNVLYYIDNGVIYAYNYNNYDLITKLSLIK